MNIDDYLSQINWNELAVAWGKAGDVPAALLGLVSPDEKTRKRSYWSLDNHIVLQSDLYEAAFYTISPLIQMLENDNKCGKEEIYTLLYELANGYSSASISINETVEIPLVNACYNEINKGMSFFLKDTKSDDIAISHGAIDLIDSL